MERSGLHWLRFKSCCLSLGHCIFSKIRCLLQKMLWQGDLVGGQEGSQAAKASACPAWADQRLGVTGNGYWRGSELDLSARPGIRGARMQVQQPSVSASSSCHVAARFTIFDDRAEARTLRPVAETGSPHCRTFSCTHGSSGLSRLGPREPGNTQVGRLTHVEVKRAEPADSLSCLSAQPGHLVHPRPWSPAASPLV